MRWTALFPLLLTTAALAQTVPVAPKPPACAAPEHRQFDFWVGYWDVYPTGKDKLVAHSLIEKLYAGCTIRENWMPLNNNTGGSLNMYDPSRKRWRQTWQDSQNGRVEFEGGLIGGKMVLAGSWRGGGPKGEDALTRMTYAPNADGSVRQSGEQSTDGGQSWAPAFDFTYRKSDSVPVK